jgi:hypothetical protein
VNVPSTWDIRRNYSILEEEPPPRSKRKPDPPPAPLETGDEQYEGCKDELSETEESPWNVGEESAAPAITHSNGYIESVNCNLIPTYPKVFILKRGSS